MNDPWSMFFGQMGASFEQAQRNTPPKPPVRPRKPKGKPVTRLLKSLLITFVFALVYFYFKLPALNVHSGDLYWFILLLCAVFSVSMLIFDRYRGANPGEYVQYCRKKLAVPFWLAAAVNKENF